MSKKTSSPCIKIKRMAALGLKQTNILSRNVTLREKVATMASNSLSSKLGQFSTSKEAEKTVDVPRLTSNSNDGPPKNITSRKGTRSSTRRRLHETIDVSPSTSNSYDGPPQNTTSGKGSRSSTRRRLHETIDVSPSTSNSYDGPPKNTTSGKGSRSSTHRRLHETAADRSKSASLGSRKVLDGATLKDVPLCKVKSQMRTTVLNFFYCIVVT